MRTKSIRYLRVSLTDLCNFRCAYCMPPEGVRKIPHSEMLRFDEMISIIRLLAARFGITKVRVTGGEPLVRREVCTFLAQLCRVPGLTDVSLTTNGYFLDEMAADIRRAGVKRLNISLDTFRHDLFREITGVDGLDRTLRGIETALASGFSPVKLNVVVLRTNLDEVLAFVAFARNTGVEVRFIEQMPIRAQRSEYIPNSEVKRLIEERHGLSPVAEDGNPGSSAMRYTVDGGPAICGFISPMTEPFCSACDRIRLRGDGMLIPCLLDAEAHDLRPCVRPLFRIDALAETIERALRRSSETEVRTERAAPMPQIGG